MRRRALLGAAGTAVSFALAGCFMEPPDTSLRLVPATDEVIVDDLAIPADGFPPERQSLVNRLFEAESITATEDYEPRLRDGTFVRKNGDFYRIGTTLMDKITAEGYGLEVQRLDDDATPTAEFARTIAFAELPAMDRRAIDRDRLESLASGMAAAVFVDDSSFDPSGSAIAAADGPVLVRYEGRQFQVRYDGPETQEDERYRYRLRKLADSPDEFVDVVVDQFLFTIESGSLSSKQRSIIEAAIVVPDETVTTDDGHGYSEDDDLSDAFRSLLERIANHDRPWAALSVRQWLCRYDATRYWAIIEHATDLEAGKSAYRTPTPPDG